MVIDAVTDRLFGKPYDRDGRIAASGTYSRMLSPAFCVCRFFIRSRQRRRGAKNSDASSCGSSSKRCGRAPKNRCSRDRYLHYRALHRRCLAPLCSAARKFRRHSSSPEAAQIIPTLLAMLANELRPLGLTIRASDEFGMPSEAKEAAAFALMAYETWNRSRRMCPLPRGRSGWRSWERSRMRERGCGRRDLRRASGCTSRDASRWRGVVALARPYLPAWATSCSSKPDPNTLVMIIESSPTNLDPRVGLDAQSERIDDLIFDDLLTRDEHLNVRPGLAERWEIPDPRTYIFHLHQDVKVPRRTSLDRSRREVDIRLSASGQNS